MKLLRDFSGSEGWPLRGQGLPIQVGVKTGATPFSGPHRHRTMAEYFIMLEGELRLRVGGDDVALATGDLVVVEPGEAHEVIRASADARILLLMPPEVPGDKEELEEQKRKKVKGKSKRRGSANGRRQ